MIRNYLVVGAPAGPDVRPTAPVEEGGSTTMVDLLLAFSIGVAVGQWLTLYLLLRAAGRTQRGEGI